MPELPTGTFTFLFIDVEGSTRLWEPHHDAIIEEEVDRHSGVVVRPCGEGDSRYAAAAIQQALALDEAFDLALSAASGELASSGV